MALDVRILETLVSALGSRDQATQLYNAIVALIAGTVAGDLNVAGNEAVTGTLAVTGATTHVGRTTVRDGVAGGDDRVVGGRASSAAGVAVHDSAAEAVSASYTIPANTLKAGSVVKVRGRLTATATVGTDTLQFKLRLGGVTLTGTALITGTATDVANADQGVFEFALFVAAAPGAAVAIVGYGQYTDPAGTTWKLATLASTNFATNAALLLEATLKWSTANANSGLVDWLEVEVL